jgi:lipopolysaccharide/colanic/teichoic acid biosynthesis glycosyltransferase
VPTVWGIGVTQLHDRYWASKGLQVIRPGGKPPEEDGPELFLLVGRGLLVDFQIGPLIKSLTWLRPLALRVRLLEREGEPYQELVLREADGRFVAFRRDYGQQGKVACQLWVTPSVELARRWQQATRGREAAAGLKRAVPRERSHSVKVRGSIFETRSPRSVERFRRHMLTSWQDPAAVVDGIYQPAPGVWIHETCTIDQSARIIGPVWIGAGHRIGPGQTLVGPAMVPDEPMLHPEPGPIDWFAVTHSRWRLLPSIRPRPMRQLSKRAFDIVVSLGVLAATLPFYPLVMGIIMLEDGQSPFFVHKRQRFGGKTFGCIKFRTMRPDAEEIKKRLMAQNLADGPQFFMKNDPRLLRCGTWMRRYKIDEFPQFINVLLGDMSIVGPRPSPDKENQYCPAWREARLSVRPGITGLWQVSSRRAAQGDFQEWIRYDLEYVQNNSWRLDLEIIAATVKRIVFARAGEPDETSTSTGTESRA